MYSTSPAGLLQRDISGRIRYRKLCNRVGSLPFPPPLTGGAALPMTGCKLGCLRSVARDANMQLTL